MALTHHTRDSNGNYRSQHYYMPPMDFVVKHIPDGVPFEIYRDAIGDDNRVTDDFDALKEPGEYHIVESPGGGAIGGVLKVFTAILNPILKLLLPSQKVSTPGLDNQQAASPNNSLTDRNNKPRPYERTYDICGTVQSIPADLMTTYRVYNNAGTVIEYGFYDVGRDYIDTPVSGITDGDTLLADITGSSAAVYAPFASPNNGIAPQTLVGSAITEKLYITSASNEIDGQTLKAPNDLQANVGDVATAFLTGTIGVITDPTGDAEFNEFLSVGDTAKLTNISVDVTPGVSGNDAVFDGYYVVTAVSDVEIRLNVASNLAEWQKLGGTTWTITPNDNATVGPQDTVTKSLTDWVTIDRIKPERILANISADNGMYKDNGNSSKKRASVTAEIQFQLIGDDGVPYGTIYTQQGTITGRSSDATGVTIIGVLPTPSAVRVRARRVTNLDLDFEGQVVDEIKYSNLYGQIKDTTPHYGNRTTVHTARKQTARATAVKQPQLKLLVTEKVFKYLGNGVFDSVRSNNTQAVQSLIRLMRDPIVGNLSLSTATMDALLATQDEVESYFQSALAGQFCYTFDKYTDTSQDIITTIAEAIFCSATRSGQAIKLNLERPRPGPEMVFTHRSKAPTGEKWTRQFNDKSAFDSLKFSYIDPDTNIKETIQIPETGGLKTDTFDSKGIRNYKQAYWHAWRRYQRNSLNRVSVEFTALEEGILAVPARPISVVKGSRVSPYDGYVVAVDGLTLVLSQNVGFTPGEDHSLILKRREGGVQSVPVVPGHNDRTVIMLSAPQEAIYTGNSALKTEFSFGSDSRHAAQMMMVSTVEPGDDRTVRITGFNYDADYYKYDGVPPFGRAFSDGFNNGFS
ncbi:MAG: host specificity factor TipJ family phage tail protein [Cetobacterium sp.]